MLAKKESKKQLLKSVLILLLAFVFLNTLQAETLSEFYQQSNDSHQLGNSQDEVNKLIYQLFLRYYNFSPRLLKGCLLYTSDAADE